MTALHRYDVDDSTDEFARVARVPTSIVEPMSMSATRAGDGATIDDRVGTTRAGDATAIEFETSEQGSATPMRYAASDDECAAPSESAPRDGTTDIDGVSM